MTDFENQKEQLASFHDEIKKLVERESGSYHFKNIKPESLDPDDLEDWNNFKKLVRSRDKDEINSIADDLKLKTTKLSPDESKKEFRSWIGSKLAPLKSAAQSAKGGHMSEEEFKEEMDNLERQFLG